MSAEDPWNKCNDKLIAIESKLQVFSDEINSLRASRHEHGNWLNRHNLELNELMLHRAATNSTITNLSSKIDKLETDVTTLQITIIQQIATLKSDLRQTMWIVSLIIGLIVFFGRGIASKYGF